MEEWNDEINNKLLHIGTGHSYRKPLTNEYIIKSRTEAHLGE